MTNKTYNHGVCKGAIALGTGCMRCERCAEQLAARVQELEAEIAAVGAGGVQALSAAPAMPAGWKLVPVEPTAMQLTAGCPVGEVIDHFDLATAYRAMLAASPTPPAEQQAQPSDVYAELPRAGAIGYASVVDIDSYVTRMTIGPHLPGVRDIALWTTDQLRDFADRTHARRIASHGQAPAQPADAENLRRALQFYADGEHFIKSDGDAWDTVSGEPQNYWCDEAGTATVEDGSIAKLALEGHAVRFEDDDTPSPKAAQAEQQAAPKAAPGEPSDRAAFFAWWGPYQLPDYWASRIDVVAWHAWQAAMTHAATKAAPQQEAQEPVMIYHGRCTIDCGEHGHHDVELLRLIPKGSKLYTTPQQEAQEPARLSDEQIKAHGDKAAGMMARDQTRFDAACEVMNYLKALGAPGYYTHRMSIVLHGNTEGTEAARAPDTAPQPAPAPLSEQQDAARWRMLPAFFEEYQIDAMKLYRDIDASLSTQQGGGA